MRQNFGLYRFTLPVLTIFLLFFYACSSSAGQNNGVDSGNEQNVPGWFWSNVINSSLKIHIQLPSSYATDLTKNYPVVYLLDADWYFYPSSRIGNKGISDMVIGMAANNHIPEIILVGICEIDKFGNNMRGRDFHSDRENFLEFLQNELIPYINNNYRTAVTGDFSNTLIGHSSGGHFALFSLFNYREEADISFGNFISLSGSIEGDDYEYIYTHEEEMYISLSPKLILRKKLFLGTGDLEEERFITGFQRMKDLIQARDYKEFKFRPILFNNLDHGTIVYPGIEEGLKFVFENDN